MHAVTDEYSSTQTCDTIPRPQADPIPGIPLHSSNNNPPHIYTSVQSHCPQPQHSPRTDSSWPPTCTASVHQQRRRRLCVCVCVCACVCHHLHQESHKLIDGRPLHSKPLLGTPQHQSTPMQHHKLGDHPHRSQPKNSTQPLPHFLLFSNTLTHTHVYAYMRGCIFGHIHGRTHTDSKTHTHEKGTMKIHRTSGDPWPHRHRHATCHTFLFRRIPKIRHQCQIGRKY